MPQAPLLNIELLPRRSGSRNSPPSSPTVKPRRPWTSYLPLCFAVILITVPQISWTILVSRHHFQTLQAPLTGIRHLVSTTILTLLALTSLIICSTRDPGRPRSDDISERAVGGEQDALIEQEDDFNSEKKWCRVCWAPKPERTHHCSTCERCVLRMDHHCPWILQCVGHRTLPAFIHLLFCITCLSLYILIVALNVVYYILFAPVAEIIDDPTAIHALVLSMIGFVFFMAIGSFLSYHLYLCGTNQTTLEQLSPYLLLRFLRKPQSPPRHVPGTSITDNVNSAQKTAEPHEEEQEEEEEDDPFYFPSPPSSPKSGKDKPWDEHELSFAQRAAVKKAHGRIRPYDLGWKQNYKQILGFEQLAQRQRGRSRERTERAASSWIRTWAEVVLYGGRPRGSGKSFPLNPKAKAMFERLAAELDEIHLRERQS